MNITIHQIELTNIEFEFTNMDFKFYESFFTGNLDLEVVFDDISTNKIYIKTKPNYSSFFGVFNKKNISIVFTCVTKKDQYGYINIYSGSAEVIETPVYLKFTDEFKDSLYVVKLNIDNDE